MDAFSPGPAIAAFPLAVFGPLDWGVLGIYFAAMIYIGVVAARKDQDAREYFLAHRSIPTWAVAISIVATSLSAATFIGVPDEACNGNITYLLLSMGGLIAVVVVAVLFVPRLYRAGTVTIYGYLGERYGPGATVAVSVVFLLGRMLASGARLFIAAVPVCLLMFARRGQNNFVPTAGQLALAICLIGLIGTFYTSFGGIRTVIWIDVIQFFIVVIAAVLSVAMLLHKTPLSPGQMLQALRDPTSGPDGHGKLFLFDTSFASSHKYTIWTALFGSTFLNMAAFGVDQDLAQRFLVAKSVTRGALSLIWAQLISLCVVCGFLTIGLLLHLFYRQQSGSTAPVVGAYPNFLLNEMPTVLSGLAIVGFFAIAQGSMDSAINALASSAVADIYYPLRRRLGHPADPARDTATPKIAVAVMGVLMSLLAIACVFMYDPKNNTLINFALGILAFPFAGMLGVFLAALLTKRGNTMTVILALITGILTVVLLQPAVLAGWSTLLLHHPLKLASMWWTPIGTAVSFLVCVSGSAKQSTTPGGFPVVQSSTRRS
jgi:SSS family solute:Na+ symporter